MELLVTAVAMATTIGLRDPLWRDPGLDLVKFLSTGGTRQPASNVQFRRGRASAVFENDDGRSTQYQRLLCRTFKLPPKICSPVRRKRVCP